ncbi:hypothetical protein L7F22_040851 [Adiantum nelumboides]|nr:hypothetical protein [Adiantum nelumboides]
MCCAVRGLRAPLLPSSPQACCPHHAVDLGVLLPRLSLPSFADSCFGSVMRSMAEGVLQNFAPTAALAPRFFEDLMADGAAVRHRLLPWLSFSSYATPVHATFYAVFRRETPSLSPCATPMGAVFFRRP